LHSSEKVIFLHIDQTVEGLSIYVDQEINEVSVLFVIRIITLS